MQRSAIPIGDRTTRDRVNFFMFGGLRSQPDDLSQNPVMGDQEFPD